MQNKGNTGILLFFFLIIIAVVFYFNQDLIQFEPTGGAGEDTPPTSPNNTTNITNITDTQLEIAFFNIQIFGTTKASNEQIMFNLDAIISNYDVVFIQEIRDISQTAFPALCDRLEGYSCVVGERKGRTTSKEQIGLIYRNIELEEVIESYNYTNWERPPTTFIFDGFTVIVLHSKPTDAESEIDLLDDYATTFEGRVIVGGDMNMDCSYYDEDDSDDFAGWQWLISNSEDTTVSSTDCTYDRIFINSALDYDSGVDRSITEDTSDHYPVWFNLPLESPYVF